MSALNPLEEALLREVSQDQLMEYNRGIASFLRDSGTPEELESFHYIEAELHKAGIKTELLMYDGYVSLPVAAQVRVNGRKYPCLTHAMSTSVSNLAATAVYAGKGKPADYQGLAVQGKIVVVEGLCMPVPVKAAEDNGALGIIFLNDEHIHNMIGSSIWGSPSIEDYGNLPKIAFLSVDAFSAREIRAAFQEGPVEVVMSTVVDTGWRKLPTLVGTVAGRETPDKFLMLSNHVDGWVYGAMDNGSANAALMQVVKILNAHKDLLKRSIKICFWSGHSHGRYAGSTCYCDDHYEELYENCFLHVNADSLGAQGSEILSEANSMAETKGLAAPIIKAIAGQDFNSCRYGRAGDQSFWGTGTPSLFMGLSEQPIGEGTAAKSFAELMGNGKTGGFGWWWHSSEDTIDKIDPERLARDCKVYLLTVYRACSADYLPIDENKAAQDILGILQAYAARVADKCDLSLALARAEKLVEVTAAIEAHKEALGSRRYNEYVMALSRLLVPLNYVEGSRFEHDIAVRGNDMPVLTVLDRYQGVARGSDQWKLVNVAAIRRLNKVCFVLKEAVKLAASYLS